MSNYDFRSLAPLDFEELVRDLLQAEFGILLESFGPGRDLGIDFRFSRSSSLIIVQAKHYAEGGFRALVKVARKEDAKIAALASTRYIFATSVSLSPTQKEKLRQALPSAPLTTGDIFGREDLNNLLGQHPEVEKKHFKLWFASTAAMERILHCGLYNRTQIEMDEISSIVRKFVDNESLPKAQAILETTGALIIAGQPGVGKSTLARMLIWLHAQNGWNVSVIDNVADAFVVPNDGRPQVVFFDDFLGQVRLTTDWLRSVDQVLPSFFQRAKSTKSLRFIMTTRDYVLHQAQAQSDRLSSAAVRVSELVLNVGVYTRAIKARMLYNHIFFSKLAPADRRALLADDFFLTIINHRNFNPRIIDQITSSDYAALLDGPVRAAVSAVLDNPDVLWEKPYRSHISDDARSLMLCLFYNENTIAIDDLEAAFDPVSRALGHTMPKGDLPARFRTALRELEGSVFAIENRKVTFSNPGVRDFLQRVAEQDRVLPNVLDALRTFGQIKQAWDIWTAKPRTPELVASMTPSWNLAAKRIVASDGGTPVTRTQLLIDLFDELKSKEVAGLALAFATDLADAELEPNDARAFRYLSEAMRMTLLPIEIADELRAAATQAGARLLRDYGGAFDLDAIDDLSDSLRECDADEETISSSSRAAIEGFLQDLDAPLSDIRSVKELAGFEQKLVKAMRDYDVVDTRVDALIEGRRERLADQPEADASPAKRFFESLVTITDDEIRSLFRSLNDV